MIARVLLVLVCAFAALSSSTAALLGLEEERVVLFCGLVGTLLLAPVLARPRVPRPDGPLVLLFLLLALIAVQDALVGRLDPVDYKVLLPLLVLLAAPALVRGLGADEVAPFAWRLLSLYVAGTFAYQTLAEPAAVARGYAGIVRYDPTGSVVMHSSLSLIHLLLSLAKARAADGPRARAVALGMGALALAMILQSATRTVLVTLAVFALLTVAAAPDRRAAAGTLAAAGLGLGLVFAAYSALVNPSFLMRLAGAEGVQDYGSGRVPSVAFWLGLAGERPFGLGFGAVRELMADGKPSLDGTSTLEWPHNEVVRFYVEAGPAGLAFVLLLVATLVRTALRSARRDPDPVRRTLALAVAADLVAEACLQNLLNAIYHATVLVIFLGLAAAAAGARGATAGAAPRPAAAPAGQGPLPAPS